MTNFVCMVLAVNLHFLLTTYEQHSFGIADLRVKFTYLIPQAPAGIAAVTLEPHRQGLFLLEK